MARARVGMIVGIAALLLAVPAMVEAHDGHGRWGGRRGWRRHGGHHQTVVIQRSPHVQIVFRGRPYYYNSGRFYERRVRSYVNVAAPVGITVRELPVNHETVVLNGDQYHCYDGVYYKGGPAGYQVVSFPIATAPGSVAPYQVASVPDPHDGDRVTVNVPNKNGSYTPVVLREVNGLYMGPNGEVYSTAPTTEQLKIMYGK